MRPSWQISADDTASGNFRFSGPPPAETCAPTATSTCWSRFLPDADIDLVDYAGLMLDLSHLLGRKVDLVSKNGLKPLIRASVLEEARLLYAA